MENKKDLNAKLKEEFDSWKAKLEELELQLSLGKMEAADEFDKQKKNFKQFVGEASKKVDELKAEGGSAGDTLKGKLDELQVQLALGKAESKEAYEEQKKKIENSVSLVVKQVDELKKDSDSRFQDFIASLEEKAEDFKTNLDMYRVHFALGKAEAKDKVEEEANALRKKVAELQSKLDAAEEKLDDKWDEVGSELSDAYKHITSAFKKLIS